MRGEIIICEPCPKCGGTERYANSNQCRSCKIRIATERNKTRQPKARSSWWER